MLRRRKKHQEEDMSQINVTSLVDVLMVLLCFFMMLETATDSLAFNLNLPDVVTLEAPEVSTILISYNGKHLFITTNTDGDIPIQREMLMDRLKRLKRESMATYDIVVIRADKKLKYKEIISMMDDIKRAGFEKISLATSI